jgi:gas vesicle protein
MAIDSNLILSVIGLLAGVITTIIGAYEISRSGERTEKGTKEKIDSLANLLKSAGSEMEKLENEVTSKSKRLQELDETSQRLDTLVSLKGKQVEAIREELKTTLKESNRSNRIWTILVGAIWFILGLIVRGFLRF